MKRVFFSVDMEQDCTPYLDTYRGIEEGTGPLLDVLHRERIRATFFVTGQVAGEYPRLMESIVARGHELGCHGDTHGVFTEMDYDRARLEIVRSARILRQFGPVTAFRAPNLRFPAGFLAILAETGFRVDSSQARYKIDYYREPRATPLKRIPVSVTSSLLRLPRWVWLPILRCLSDPIVLFVHPWEFVDLRRTRLRLDCRFRTGIPALDSLRAVLAFLKQQNACFLRMKDSIGAGGSE